MQLKNRFSARIFGDLRKPSWTSARASSLSPAMGNSSQPEWVLCFNSEERSALLAEENIKDSLARESVLDGAGVYAFRTER
jgi:hypothetical protein